MSGCFKDLAPWLSIRRNVTCVHFEELPSQSVKVILLTLCR
jgi:hypothetical protein